MSRGRSLGNWSQKQKEISERKTTTIQIIGGRINIGTGYADALKRNTNRRRKNTATENNDPTNKNDLKEQMKNIDERLKLVEGHCAYELLNEEEVEEMETSDAENEETNVEKLKLKFNNEETDKKMEETFNYIYETVNHC
ncbi:hypothetical protein Glove_83g104 [Diversispora epigaea]|uniref:Uncharacterized protein n=1 Tax=Diversispora epigaea TaxID=1348612 RepID=A0A397J7I7_9GLOM|nr:hypothetical protein Glove_83g104 [Diversispora epigaea]